MEWEVLAENAEIPAKPRGVWTRVLEFVAAGSTIKIEVRDAEKAAWNYAAGKGCSADGDATSLISRSSCVNVKAPVGALIGKMGGSTAGVDTDGTIFVAGSWCVVAVTAGGPLYLTINDEESGMWNNSGSMVVTVSKQKS